MRHESQHDDSIQRADPAARARALRLIAAVLVVVGLLAAASIKFEDRLDPWTRAVAMDLVARPELLYIALFVVMLPLLGVSVYVFLQGRRIVVAQRMPYPGQKVIKDTPVISGSRAVQRGRIVQLIALVMGLFSLVLPFIPPLMMLYLSKGN